MKKNYLTQAGGYAPRIVKAESFEEAAFIAAKECPLCQIIKVWGPLDAPRRFVPEAEAVAIGVREE